VFFNTNSQISPPPTDEPKDEADSLDEACPSEAPPTPVRTAATAANRPRLAILLQACKAVVGAGHLLNGEALKAPAEADKRKEQSQTQVPAELDKQHAKYESPLIAKLREVEVI